VRAVRPGSVTFVLMGAVLFGTAGTAAAFAPTEASASAIGGMRLAIGAIALVVAIPFFGGRWAMVPHLARRPTVWVMALTTASYQPLFFGAMERSGVALSTLLTVGSAPIFSGVLGRILLKQPLTRAWLLATGLAIAGLTLRSWGEFELGDALGPVMAIGAGLAIAGYFVAAKAELTRGAHAIALPATAYLIGSLLLTPLLVTQPLGWLTSLNGITVAIYLGVMTMAVANVSVIIGLRGMAPGPAATLQLADPLTATMLGILLLGETVSPIGIVGIVLVLIGLVLQSRALARTAKPAPPAPQLL
jgi:drug/metabolite transporter, DME family